MKNPHAEQPMVLPEIEFAQNPEPRCACGLFLDRSGSMSGAPIAQLNAGLRALRDYLVTDSLATLRVELALVSFNEDVTVDIDFTTPDKFQPPTLATGGGTALAAAVMQGLDLLEARVASYRAAGLSYYRPWAVLITDAEAGDDVTAAARRVKAAESAKRLAFFGVGVQGANMSKLAELSLRPPLRLDGLRFTDLFQWLSVSLGSVAESRPGDQVPLLPPNWSAV